MRKVFSLLVVVVVLGISTPAKATASRRDGDGAVQRIVAALKRSVARILDAGDIGWPKP